MFGKTLLSFSLFSIVAAAPVPLPYVFGDRDQSIEPAVQVAPLPDQPAPVDVPSGVDQPAPATPPPPPAAATVPRTPAVPTVAPVAQTTPAPAAPRSPRAPAAPRAPETTPTPPTPAVAPTPPPAPRALGQLANVQVEVVVTDQAPGEPPNRQAISAVAADRESASVRNSPDLRGGRNISLDIRPVIAEGTRVRLNLGLEYWLQSVSAEDSNPDDRKHPVPQVRMTQNVVLESGRPLVISQSTAPGTQRTVTVEVKATVLR